MIHDTVGGGEHKEAEMARRQQLLDPAVEVGKLKIEAGADDTTLVQATAQLNNNLAGALVVDDLKLADVSCRQ